MTDTPNLEPTELAYAFARLFATDDGRAVLRHLRTVTLERVMGPEATDAQLRDLEGARRLVKRIENMIASGRMKP